MSQFKGYESSVDRINIITSSEDTAGKSNVIAKEKKQSHCIRTSPEATRARNDWGGQINKKVGRIF